MTEARPAELLRLLADVGEQEPVAGALVAAIRSIGTGRAANLEAALGFVPGDLRRWARARRDTLLREAAAALPADLSPWQQAGALADLVLTTEHHRGRIHRRDGAGQWEHGAVVGLLVEAERWHKLPATAMGMAGALRGDNKARPRSDFVRRPAA
jgi:hypothetical protein